MPPGLKGVAAVGGRGFGASVVLVKVGGLGVGWGRLLRAGEEKSREVHCQRSREVRCQGDPHVTAREPGSEPVPQAGIGRVCAASSAAILPTSRAEPSPIAMIRSYSWSSVAVTSNPLSP